MSENNGHDINTEVITPSLGTTMNTPTEDRTHRNADNLAVNGLGGLEARDVHAWFNKHHALADVSLHFPHP